MGGKRLSGREKFLIFAGCLILFLLIGRAAQVQIIHHEFLSEEAMTQQCDTLPIQALRGSLEDRNGTVLVQSLENPSLWADPKEVSDPVGLDRALANLGWTKPGLVSQKIENACQRRFVWLYRDWASWGNVAYVESLWAGAYHRVEPKRLYPSGPLLASILGFVGRDGAGLSGLELELDPLLKGHQGWEQRFVTGGNRPTASLPPRIIEVPQPGQNVQLTIDLRIQEITQRRLQEGVIFWKARAAFALVMDPMTGEMLAIASVPNPDSTLWRRRNGHPWRQRPICDQWEPGSTFKIVTFAAAIENGRIDLDEPIDCENGKWITADWKIGDHERYGILSTRDVLVHSSNIGTAKIALRIGTDEFYRMVRHLGFGSQTGIPFPGEAKGRVLEPDRWNRRSLPTMGFGQELSVNCLQMAMCYAAVANGGNLLKPQLIREVRDARGKIVQKCAPRVVRPVLKKTTCKILTELLRQVVVDGTGTLAEIPWFPPAGKTGTSEMYDPELGTYSSTDYMASFIGFAPWYEPRYLCCVVLDSPQGSIYGGQTAAPIFKAIMEDLTAVHGGMATAEVQVFKDEEKPQPLPDVRGLSPDEARRVIKEAGFIPVLEGRGLRIKEMNPAPGSLGIDGGVVRLFPGGSISEEEQVMPNLLGWPLRRAIVLLSRRGVEWTADGEGWISGQSPLPGEVLKTSAVCRLTATHQASHAWMKWRMVGEGVADAAPWGNVKTRP
ncbi:MAG: PASTA domain-containing protein [Candidatus Eisenbacteria bacterium]|uniref:PASTA domain-containing protein n=1 Tax=Eiseniibacteriota bacterium TaxID=2212470 RepID=A0A948RZT1_UNCEI|nr:PASTA domain-containing protein [Candidatus Eisenbacteria bacterium]MBU1950408.1 PASTA domain-containing protein [Candidatus Eisenbacteria bacterium]MBU2692971.1 PASTA domain-containing protein [Candidatus Eisenbacteria bacterium]